MGGTCVAGTAYPPGTPELTTARHVPPVVLLLLQTQWLTQVFQEGKQFLLHVWCL
jgi:hypothetical protein